MDDEEEVRERPMTRAERNAHMLTSLTVEGVVLGGRPPRTQEELLLVLVLVNTCQRCGDDLPREEKSLLCPACQVELAYSRAVN